MRINYDKCDSLTIDIKGEEANSFSRFFYCKRGTFPFRYLGAPLHFSKLRREDIQPIIDKIVKRITDYRRRLLLYGGKLALHKSCLPSIPIYLMSVIKFPR